MPDFTDDRVEYQKRIRAARARAQWELGNSTHADVIIYAFLHPDEDTAALKEDMEDD